MLLSGFWLKDKNRPAGPGALPRVCRRFLAPGNLTGSTEWRSHGIETLKILPPLRSRLLDNFVSAKLGGSSPLRHIRALPSHVIVDCRSRACWEVRTAARLSGCSAIMNAEEDSFLSPYMRLGGPKKKPAWPDPLIGQQLAIPTVRHARLR